MIVVPIRRERNRSPLTRIRRRARTAEKTRSFLTKKPDRQKRGYKYPDPGHKQCEMPERAKLDLLRGTGGRALISRPAD